MVLEEQCDDVELIRIHSTRNKGRKKNDPVNDIGGMARFLTKDSDVKRRRPAKMDQPSQATYKMASSSQRHCR